MDRRVFLTGASALMALPTTTLAYSPVTYGPSTWSDVRDSAERVVVNFRAEWSLTCQMKRELLQGLLEANPDYQRLTFVDVDWDTFGRSDWVQRRLKVERRSTLIAFEGKKEIARIVNEPFERPMRAFLDRALA
jgi:hypothetical protein